MNRYLDKVGIKRKIRIKKKNERERGRKERI